MKDLLARIGALLADLLSVKFTGKIVLEINLNQGGVGNCTVRTERKL